jgi:hypothetical protein
MSDPVSVKMEVAMDWEALFGAASTAAAASWVLLILAPRHRVVTGTIRLGVVGGLALIYAALILAFFFTVPGGGFGSIAEVRALFASDPVLVAGWVHYLAFDLLVGLAIAERSDGLGLSRLIQAPLLAATFMFGPLGLLLFRLVASLSARAPITEGAVA